MLTYRATLDVSMELAHFVARLLAAERSRHGTRSRTRALTCSFQAVLVLRWFRDRTDPSRLGRDHGVSRATAYRYIDEAIEVIADRAPDLPEALTRADDDGLGHPILEGTVVSAAPTTSSCAAYAASASAVSLCSPDAGAPCNASPPAAAKSAPLPKPHSSSPISNTA